VKKKKEDHLVKGLGASAKSSRSNWRGGVCKKEERNRYKEWGRKDYESHLRGMSGGGRTITPKLFGLGEWGSAKSKEEEKKHIQRGSKKRIRKEWKKRTGEGTRWKKTTPGPQCISSQPRVSEKIQKKTGGGGGGSGPSKKKTAKEDPTLGGQTAYDKSLTKTRSHEGKTNNDNRR